MESDKLLKLERGDEVKVKGELGTFSFYRLDTTRNGNTIVHVFDQDAKFRAFRPERVYLKGDKKMAAKAAAEVKTGKSKTRSKKPQDCLCTCGGKTGGGRFLPGHDARLKGRLVASAKTGDNKAVKRLEELGWGRFVPVPEVAGEAKAKVNGKAKKKGKGKIPTAVKSK